MFARLRASPNSVGFSLTGFADAAGCARREAVLAKNLPRRWRDPRVHPPSGDALKDTGCPLEEGAETGFGKTEHGLARKDSGAFCARRHPPSSGRLRLETSRDLACRGEGRRSGNRPLHRPSGNGFTGVTAQAVTLTGFASPRSFQPSPVEVVPPRSTDLGSDGFGNENQRIFLDMVFVRYRC